MNLSNINSLGGVVTLFKTINTGLFTNELQKTS